MADRSLRFRCVAVAVFYPIACVWRLSPFLCIALVGIASIGLFCISHREHRTANDERITQCEKLVIILSEICENIKKRRQEFLLQLEFIGRDYSSFIKFKSAGFAFFVSKLVFVAAVLVVVFVACSLWKWLCCEVK